MFRDYFNRLPLVAILRGVTPDEVVAIGHVLVERGFAVLEVPLNSPQPLDSIAALRTALGDRALIGAGTVLSATAVSDVAEAGGRLIVMPHADRTVIGAARQIGLCCVPGAATPTELFAALEAGADAVKLFPAELITPAILRALRSVVPQDTLLLPVGGITPEKLAEYAVAGANGFGLGAALYKPGMSARAVGLRAEAFVAAWRALRA
jgi:2-dehydro-3-deoxyphosphogalactonate aldolase